MHYNYKIMCIVHDVHEMPRMHTCRITFLSYCSMYIIVHDYMHMSTLQMAWVWEKAKGGGGGGRGRWVVAINYPVVPKAQSCQWAMVIVEGLWEVCLYGGWSKGDRYIKVSIGHGTTRANAGLPGLMTSSQMVHTWYMYLIQSKWEVGCL